MSWSESGPPLQIDLQRSRLLTGYLFLLLVTVLAAIALLDAPLWFRLLLVLPVIGTIIHALCHHAWRVTGAALVELHWHGDGDWRAHTRAGEDLAMELMSDSYWHARVLVLNFRSSGRRHSVVLLPDMLERNLFRQLRVRLLLEGVPSIPA